MSASSVGSAGAQRRGQARDMIALIRSASAYAILRSYIQRGIRV